MVRRVVTGIFLLSVATASSGSIRNLERSVNIESRGNNGGKLGRCRCPRDFGLTCLPTNECACTAGYYVQSTDSRGYPSACAPPVFPPDDGQMHGNAILRNSLKQRDAIESSKSDVLHAPPALHLGIIPPYPSQTLQEDIFFYYPSDDSPIAQSSANGEQDVSNMKLSDISTRRTARTQSIDQTDRGVKSRQIFREANELSSAIIMEEGDEDKKRRDTSNRRANP